MQGADQSLRLRPTSEQMAEGGQTVKIFALVTCHRVFGSSDWFSMFHVIHGETAQRIHILEEVKQETLVFEGAVKIQGPVSVGQTQMQVFIRTSFQFAQTLPRPRRGLCKAETPVRVTVVSVSATALWPPGPFMAAQSVNLPSHSA